MLKQDEIVSLEFSLALSDELDRTYTLYNILHKQS